MKKEEINSVLLHAKTGPTKWELDELIYHDRMSNPKTLVTFLKRIQFLLDNKDKITKDESNELVNLISLLHDMEVDDCLEVLNSDDDSSKNNFIEETARKGAIEILTNGRISYETLEITCKLSPTDFILCAKRTQDLITAIQGLVIKGETLSKDIAGA